MTEDLINLEDESEQPLLFPFFHMKQSVKNQNLSLRKKGAFLWAKNKSKHPVLYLNAQNQLQVVTMQGETTEGTVVSVFKSYNGNRAQV